MDHARKDPLPERDFTLKMVCAAIIWPLFMCYAMAERQHLAELKQEQFDHGYRAAHSPPKDVHARRKRRPFERSNIKSELEDRTTPQLGCALLTKLPFDLREAIWKECLGGRNLQLAWRSSGYPCKSASRKMKCTLCMEKWRVYGNQHRLEDHIMFTSLSLILTCHQIYSEVTTYFYSYNSSTTNIADQIEFMPRELLRSRIDCIRVLYFRWRILREPPFPSPKRWRPEIMGETPRFKNGKWVATWRVLASMKSLQSLCVKLDVGRSVWEDMAVNRAVLLLKPIMEVTRPREFRLELPFIRVKIWRLLREIYHAKSKCIPRYGPW